MVDLTAARERIERAQLSQNTGLWATIARADAPRLLEIIDRWGTAAKSEAARYLIQDPRPGSALADILKANGILREFLGDATQKWEKANEERDEAHARIDEAYAAGERLKVLIERMRDENDASDAAGFDERPNDLAHIDALAQIGTVLLMVKP